MTKLPVWSIKLKKHCAKKGLTAKKVSELTGLSKPTIDSYFQGKQKPKDDNKKLLAEKIGLDVYEIFFNDDISDKDKKIYFDLRKKGVK